MGGDLNPFPRGLYRILVFAGEKEAEGVKPWGRSGHLVHVY